jgi:hypothetical protein
MPTFVGGRAGAHVPCEPRSAQVESLFALVLTVRIEEDEPGRGVIAPAPDRP